MGALTDWKDSALLRSHLIRVANSAATLQHALSEPELFHEEAMLVKTGEDVTDGLHLGTKSFGGRLQPAPS